MERIASRLSIIFVLAATGATGCDTGCDVGDTTCEDEFILVCVQEMEDPWEEDDGSCGFLCDLFEIWDSDTYWTEKTDCSKLDKICVEKTNDHGQTYADCGFDPDL